MIAANVGAGCGGCGSIRRDKHGRMMQLADGDVGPDGSDTP